MSEPIDLAAYRHRTEGSSALKLSTLTTTLVEEKKKEEEVEGCPHVSESERTADLLADMRRVLQSWRVWHARQIIATVDPVAVAWAIADTEDALACGDVDNPGGLFLWFLKQGHEGAEGL